MTRSGGAAAREKVRRGFTEAILREVTMHEHPIRQLSIDRSSSAIRSVSIDSPSVNMLEANVPGQGYCFVAPVGRTASPYIQHLYG
jgi:hypothetical protein